MLKTLTLAAALTAFAGAAVHAQSFSFVALGDMPYGEPDKVYAPFETLIGAINERAPDLVLHIGDTKSGGTPCSDQMLTDQLNYMNSFDAPVLYTPGDNEWTDCHRKKAGRFDPLDRLAFIREAYFGAPTETLGGTKAAVEHQGGAGFPENARMLHKGVMFVTAHVVGSNNNFEIRDMKAVEEFFARNEATTAWMEESFAAASGADAIVLGVHANMFEFDFNEFGKEGWLRHSGFKTFGPALQKAAADFGKPVLLVYGDSHNFRITRPFRKTAPNLTALEVYGSKDMHAVEVTVDASTPGVFGFAPLLNPALTQ